MGQAVQEFFLDCLALQDGTDRFYSSVGKQFRTNAEQYARGSKVSED